MIGRLASLILLSTLTVTEKNEVPQQISVTVAKLGDNVTLTCKIPSDDVGLFYWYKLNYGYMVQTVANGNFEKILFQINNSRFSVTKVGNVLSLTIRNVSKEDEATYFCQAGSAYSITFINSTIVAVNDPKTQHKYFTVKQTPDVNSVYLGDTMTLQCSLLSENKDDTDQCPNEDKVHWFKGASESHPGVIYHGSLRSKEDGRCDYSLSKTVTNSSDAGTYYCAVVTCGQILFGRGTEVEIEEFPLVTVLGALLTCSVLLNFALILSRKKIQPRKHSEGKVEVFTDVKQEKSSGDQMSNEEVEEAGLNYVALDFPSRKSSRWKSRKESPESTIYSGIREGQ
ncbi:uncharacterized protein LOC120720501 isoform X2 [Simochromis diagramma]|uniref:uncharacterized protein LOC120720501 isoform X2 n=1 Tax=Simochromis diagramma TaxID=43689 RepID=UPI001A7E2178|nr:uncharacterized protein LOC120720501 isoform X2 [Simochromis diagramma]